MKIVFWISLYIVGVAAFCVRLALVFKEKANKPIFWVVSSTGFIAFSVLVYFLVRIFDL